MTSDGAHFYFIFVDVARKGEIAPLDCVKEDIRRRLYTERRAEIVRNYEAELKHDGIASGRVQIADTTLLKSMGYVPTEKNTIQSEVENFEDIIIEEEILGEDD